MRVVLDHKPVKLNVTRVLTSFSLTALALIAVALGAFYYRCAAQRVDPMVALCAAGADRR